MNNETKLTAADWALYLGCEAHLFCETGYGGIEYERTGTLIGIKPEYDKRNGLVFMCNGGHKWPIELTYKYSEAKPILRPLSDMTEEEARELYRIFTGEFWEDAFWSDSPVLPCLENWVDIDAEGYCSYMRIATGKPYAWRYLLSRHFDLFGWIPAGLAIDKTKTVVP